MAAAKRKVPHQDAHRGRLRKKEKGTAEEEAGGVGAVHFQLHKTTGVGKRSAVFHL